MRFVKVCQSVVNWRMADNQFGVVRSLLVLQLLHLPSLKGLFFHMANFDILQPLSSNFLTGECPQFPQFRLKDGFSSWLRCTAPLGKELAVGSSENGFEMCWIYYTHWYSPKSHDWSSYIYICMYICIIIIHNSPGFIHFAPFWGISPI